MWQCTCVKHEGMCFSGIETRLSLIPGGDGMWFHSITAFLLSGGVERKKSEGGIYYRLGITNLLPLLLVTELSPSRLSMGHCYGE